jgi:hypothetical protein
MIFFNCPFVYFGVGYCQVSLFLLFVLGASPFDSFQVADVGDVNLNLYNLPKACEDIRKHFLKIIQTGCIPLALGGDHTMTYPILQAIKVHVCTNNTDRMYTLIHPVCIISTNMYLNSLKYRISHSVVSPLKLRVYILSVLLVQTCTLIVWSIG